LFFLGSDYNQAALKFTSANLIKADIWAKVIWGGVGRSNIVADDLMENYSIDLKGLLNLLSFPNYNRIWEIPKNIILDSVNQSIVALAHRGMRISNNLVEDNLLEHFSKWSPYVRKFGLLMIKLYTISPVLTADNLGKAAATACDATHGLSDQYIVEILFLQKIAAEVRSYPDTSFFKHFPDSNIATIRINLLKVN
jgi:hypothetical protein